MQTEHRLYSLRLNDTQRLNDMKKNVLLLLLFLCLILLTQDSVAEASAPSETEFYQEMPPYLRVTQSMKTQEIIKNLRIRRTVPQTANAAVDDEIAALVDELIQRGRSQLPEKPGSKAPTVLDVGPVITRTGTSWLSFLTLAEISHERERIYVDFDARVYDIETGERIGLSDVFPKDSEAWEIIAQAVRTQLSAAFPDEEADEEALNALCAFDRLQNTPFTLSAARLMLTFRADALYPGKHTLLHVSLYYPELRPYMTQRAQAQTDNSRFRMVALTYDDGGARLYTRNVLDKLRIYGASATFFIVGRNMRNNHEYMTRQHDSGYSLQSHTYTHTYPGKFVPGQIFDERDRFAKEMSDLIGIAPTMMRAPGGNEYTYVVQEIGLPLIHWSLASGDSGNDHIDGIIARVSTQAQDGDIVLMHDLNPLSDRYTAKILSDLCEAGFLCVTIEELFADAGIPIEVGKVYFNPYELKTGF